MASGARYRSLSGSVVEAYDDVPRLVSTAKLGQAASNHAFAYHLPRRRFTRYFTLAISATLVLMILCLVRSSWRSEAEIRLGLRKALSPPPAWEQFPFLKQYHGGIRRLVDKEENKPEYPSASDPEEVPSSQEAALAQQKQEDVVNRNSGAFQKREKAGFKGRSTRFHPEPSFEQDEYEAGVPCYLDDKSKLTVPDLLGYKGLPQGFPDPVMGSHDLLGLRNDICFERYGRLGPYGYGYSRKFGGSGAGMEGEREGSEEVWTSSSEGEGLEIDWRNIRWADAQSNCTRKNEHRFHPAHKQLNHFYTSTATGSPLLAPPSNTAQNDTAEGSTGKKFLPRTAVIIRTWVGYKYDSEDLFNLRALVNELALYGQGEYTVHFLIHVKDDDSRIWAEASKYQQVLDEALPAEFHGMGTLWSERQMALIYGGLIETGNKDHPIHGVYRSLFMPLQYFGHMHPEYDYFWHWEMDIRYTGHFYHLFAQVSNWARQQPRKGLWERNARFYVPSEHGTWEDFRQMVRVQTEHGTASKSSVYNRLGGDAAGRHPLDQDARRSEQPIWGPQRPTGVDDSTADPDNDPKIPTTYDKDKYKWGVGEEADLITFNPLFDPQNTRWNHATDVTGYDTSKSYPPRRSAIITASRLSRRLLKTMHRETWEKRHSMFSEMWPGSVALHHGYKAVYVPHPVYIDRAWPTSYLAAVFNNGLNGAAGGSRTSIFCEEREHNFRGTTWYYNAGFSPNLWKRWLGYKVDNDGGEQQEKGGEGRMCLPAMLLHPVKGVDLVL